MNSFFRLATIVCLLSLAQVPAVHGQSAADEFVIGLWAYETRFPVGLAGELTIERQGDLWRGSIGGATTEAIASGNNFLLDFPKEGGAFRGELDRSGRELSGFWIRRQVRTNLSPPECVIPSRSICTGRA